MEKIIPGKHVTLVYDLYAVNPDGSETLMHQSDSQDPEQIIFGVTQGVIVPLEKAIEGLVKGDKFNVVAKAEEAFGPHNPEMIVTLDKDANMWHLVKHSLLLTLLQSWTARRLPFYPLNRIYPAVVLQPPFSSGPTSATKFVAYGEKNENHGK